MSERLNTGGVEEAQNAQQQLNTFLQSYPEADLDKHPNIDKNWSKRWDKFRKCYGDNHLITLFPRDTSKNTKHWIDTLNLLSNTINERDGFGVVTKMDLICTRDTQLVQENLYSAKTLKLVDLMRAAAKEELNLTNL